MKIEYQILKVSKICENYNKDTTVQFVIGKMSFTPTASSRVFQRSSRTK